MTKLYSFLAHPLAALGLLLATAGAAQAQTFAPVATYTTGSIPQGIASADLNGDGRPDLVTTNSNTNNLGVLLGSTTAPGTFPATATFYGSGGNFPVQVGVGDVNGDGRPDIVVSNSNSNTVGVLLNSATAPGTFAAAVTYPSGASGPRGLGLADVNGDGRLDVVVGGSSTVGVLLNSATTPGTFAAGLTYPTGVQPDGIAVGDLNGDGRPDVVVTGYFTSNTVTVLLNSATAPGTFPTATAYGSGGDIPRGVTIGDVNADGRPDLVVGNETAGNNVGVLLNSATAPGTFAAAVAYPSGTTGPNGVRVRDMNGDGRPDIVAANYNVSNGSTVSVLLGSAATPGTFATGTTYSSGGQGPVNLDLGDLNNDGRPDIATTNVLSSTVGVLLNTTVFATPTLTSLSPTSGPVGTSVTLTGTNLGGAAQVLFNGTAAATFAVLSATTVTATVPTGATTGPVTVTTGGGTSNGQTFTVTTAAPVVLVPANGGFVSTATPTYGGTAPAGSTVTVYVDGSPLATPVTANGTGSWTLTQPTALAQGSHTVRATAQSSGVAVSDNSNTNTFTVDSVRPTVAISSSTAANGGSTGTSPLAFTVTFSESVTGFVAGDVSVTNGTISGFSGAGTTYTFSVTPTTPGAATTVNVPANVAQDAASNLNTAATQFSITYSQPLVATAQNVTVTLGANGTATLNASSVNNGSTGAGTLTYTIQKIVFGQVSENNTLTLTTPNGANFTGIRFASYGTPIDNGNGNYAVNNNCNAANSVTTATNAFVGRSTGSMDASNGPTANNNPTLGDPCGGIVKALAVQAAYSANAASLGYTCAEANQTQYVLLTVSDANGTRTAVAQVTVTPPPAASFTLSPASGNAGDVITASGSNLSGATALTVNGTPATVSGLTASGFTFVVPAGATAGAGNVVLTTPCGQAPSAAFTVTQPVTAAPVVSTPANGSLTNNRTVTVTGTAPANSAVSIYILGNFVDVTAASASGAFSYTIGSPAPNGTYTVFARAQSAGASQSANSNTNTFTVDGTAPTVALSSSTAASGASTSTSPFAYTVTFSESVTGFVAGDVTVSNGTISGFSGSGTTYTFNVTPTTAGTVTTVTVPQNVAQDAAGNGNTAAASAYALTFTAPTLTVGPTTLPGGTQGTAYSQTLTAAGGTSPYTFAITAGALPTGLSLTAGGILSGTPTASGSFTFTVTATDASAAPGPYTGARSYSFAVAAPALTVWTGAVSTDWYTATNWTGGVPTASLDATIPTVPSGGRFPAINAGTANVRQLTLNSGASLTQTGGTLNVFGNLTNNGTFAATGGTVSLGTTVAGSLLGSGSTRFWNLTVSVNGAQLATSAGASVRRLLTLNGNLATNGNPFTLESNANITAVVVNNGSYVVSGTATVQRYIDPSLNPNAGYRHVSSPVATATVGSLATAGFAPVVNPAYNTAATPLAVTPFPTVYGYDQARLATTANNLNAFDKGWFSPAALSDPLAVGQGYTVNLAANQTWNFTGALNNGNVTVNLARNAGATAPDAGYALIGNPYPSPLDWFQTTLDAGALVNVGSTMYVYRSNDPGNPYSGAYGFFNNGIGTISNVLPVGQGFFVRVADGQTAGSVTFKNSHRPTSYAATTYQRTTAETRPLVELHLQGTGSPLTDAAFVYFEQGATDSFDARYDAEKLANPSGLNLSTSLTATQRLSIDGRAPLGTAPVTVPLAVGVPAVGSYTLSAAQLLNLDTTPVYLRDRQSGAVIDLRQQASYSFTVSNAAALLTGRFELMFSPQAVLATAPAALAAQVGLYPNPATTTAFVELPAALGRTAVVAILVDALGRTMRTQSLPAQGAAAHRLDLANLATGIYTLHLKTSAGVIAKKLVVE